MPDCSQTAIYLGTWTRIQVKNIFENTCTFQKEYIYLRSCFEVVSKTQKKLVFTNLRLSIDTTYIEAFLFMLNIINKDGKQYVSAKDLYKGLQLNPSQYARWIKQQVTGSQSNYKDFSTLMSKSSGGRPTIDYLLERNFAKFLCVTSGSAHALPYVEWLIGLDNRVETGDLIQSEILPAIVELIQFFCIHEFRAEAQRFHFDSFCEKHYVGEWQSYRVSLLGYSKTSLTQALAKVGEKYQSIEKSLLKLDRYELIRTSFIDLFLYLGKNEEYAKNVGELASKMAKKMENLLTFDSLKSSLFGKFHPTIEGFSAAMLQFQLHE